MPSVYNYNDHRKFLEDFILKKQGANNAYSFRLISKKAGFKSPNYVQQVISGKKNLSDGSAILLASALKLDERESKFFCLLVERDNSTSESTRKNCETQLKQIKGEFTSIAAQGHQFSLISDWFHTVILELFHMIPTPVTAKKIFDVLLSNLEIEQIENSLELLKNARLIKPSEFGFCLEDQETNIVFKKNHDPVEIRAFHSKNLQAMKDNLAFLNFEETFFQTINLCINTSKRSILKDRVTSLCKEITALELDRESTKEVVQIGLYILPITKKTN